MTIQLPEHREALIRSLVQHGAFPSEEAAIDKAFQLLEERYDDPGNHAEPHRDQGSAEKMLIDALNQRLLAAGLITELPDPAQDIDDDDPDDQPIEIEGEPLSETIIRERR
jgi:Arc/MetJ-type ribon-helix-helix transcriptional regulator